VNLLIRFWPWLAAVVSGVALAFAFPPWNQSWLAWIAFGPLIAAVWFAPASRPKTITGNRRLYLPDAPPEEPTRFVALERKQRIRRWLFRAALGYVAGLAFFWCAFAWIITVTGIGWFVLAFYLALYFAAWSWIAGLIGDLEFRRQQSVKVVTSHKADHALTFLKSRHNLVVAFFCAAAWTALEWLRGWLFTGFGWNGLGIALHENIPLIQIADITGVGGISFVLAFANVIAVITVRRIIAEVGRTRLRPHWDFSATMTMVVGLFAYGIHALQTHDETQPLTFAAVQANVPEAEKLDDAFAQGIYQRYHDLSLAAQQLKPQLLVWPEAALPAGIFSSKENFDYVKNIAQQGPGDFLLGTLDLDTPEGDFNAAALLTNQGKHYAIYHKIHLVPFGEYIPFRHSFPLFAWVVGDLVPADMTHGHDATVFTLGNGIRVAPLICFEDTVATLVTRFTNNGAQLLTTVTNDNWFLQSAGSRQHLANAVFRTIENRRPLLRCANTGVTCSVDQYGNVRQVLTDADGSTFTQGILSGVVNVPVHPRTTIYMKYGEWFSGVCAALTAVFLGSQFIRRAK